MGFAPVLFARFPFSRPRNGNQRHQGKNDAGIQRRRKETEESVAKLAHSIEVIKWCIVGITTVMALSLMNLVAVVWEIGNEAQRIKAEVEEVKGEAEAIVTQVQREADLIRHKLRHAFETPVNINAWQNAE